MAARKAVFHQLPDLPSAAHAVATVIASELTQAVSKRGTASFVLAGGSTPRGVYELLAGPAGSRIPWQQVHVFFGDERCVGAEDAASNYRLAFVSLLESLALPAANVHRIEGELGAQQASANYEAVLRKHFQSLEGDPVDGGHLEWPAFDLVLLGMGTDGHTASLFPGEPLLRDRSSWVGTSNGENADPPVPRVSLTLGAINAARRVLFLVNGAEKLALVEEIRSRSAASQRYPAAMVQPKQISWYLAGPQVTKEDS